MEDNSKILVCGGCYKPVTNVESERCDGCHLAANHRTEYLASKAKKLYECYPAEDNLRCGHTKPNQMQLLSGVVSNLEFSRGHEDFVFTQRDKNVAGTAAIDAAALGEIFNSEVLANASAASPWCFRY